MDVNYRVAIDSDCETLSCLAHKTNKEAFGHSFQPQDLEVHLSTHLSAESFRTILQVDKILVAIDDEQIIGYVQFGMLKGSEDRSEQDWELKRLYVLRDYQNYGIGGRLMELAVNQMKENQATRIYLDVWEENPGAIRFYQSFGFVVVGRRKFEVASGVVNSDDLVMVCRM